MAAAAAAAGAAAAAFVGAIQYGGAAQGRRPICRR